MSSPTEVPNLQLADSLSLAEDNACVLTSDGLAACAGDNRAGQLAIPAGAASRLDVFAIIEELSDSLRDVAVGGSTVCAVTNAARVSCWGDDSVGQTGSPIPDHAEGSVAPQSPAHVPGVMGAIDVAMGRSHACALLIRGRVMCWGHDRYGALGRGAQSTGLPQADAALIEGITDALALAVDDLGGCVVRRSGEVACWGGSVVAYPGFDPATADDCTVGPCWRGPRTISVPPAHAIVLGGGAGCVATDAGWECFGRNDHGALPTAEEPIDAEATLAMGDGHLCMRRPDGSVACRGRGVEGQLGDGRSTSTPAWTEVRWP